MASLCARASRTARRHRPFFLLPRRSGASITYSPARQLCVSPVCAGKKSSPRGQEDVRKDKFYRDAQKEGYVSRAAYKLSEIQQRHKLIKPGSRVLDLGCHPGSWLQVASRALGPPERGGLVIGIDLKETAAPPATDDRVIILQGDAFEYGSYHLLEMSPEGFHTVLSDMCPDTTGNVAVDVGGSIAVASKALSLATGPLPDEEHQSGASLITDNSMRMSDSDRTRGALDLEIAQRMIKSGSCIPPEHGVLLEGGAFVAKLLEGAGFIEFVQILRQRFREVKTLRPRATRSMSREVFAVGLGRLKPPLGTSPTGKGPTNSLTSIEKKQNEHDSGGGVPSMDDYRPPPPPKKFPGDSSW